MNNHFLAHVIRDIFVSRQLTIYYGKDIELVNTLRNSEHGIGAYHVHSEQWTYDLVDSTFWNAGKDDLSFYENCCDLFISVNYNPTVENKESALSSIGRCMKPGGIIFLCNYGELFFEASQIFKHRVDLVDQVNRYAMFKNEKVDVYESI